MENQTGAASAERDGFAERLQRTWEDAGRRDRERGMVRAALEPLLDVIAKVETELAPLSVMRGEQRYHLGQSRVEILQVLRTLDAEADEPSEAQARSMQAMISGGHQGR
jgi:hypothetical protein